MKKINLNLNLQKLNNKSKKYLIIAGAIKEKIQNHILVQGERLPSSRELAYELNTNRHTIMRAMDELIAEGYLESFEKRYYKIVNTLPDDIIRLKNLNAQVHHKQINFDISYEVMLEDYNDYKLFKFCFGAGRPDLRLFPLREFKSHLFDSINRLGINGFMYANPRGHLPLIKELEKYLAKARNIQNKEIAITHGSQEAIYILAKMFLQNNDNVAIEELAYKPAIEAISQTGANLIKIKIDSEGLITKDLETLILSGKKIKMIYITPLHQFPTTVTMSLERRIKLYELCVKNKIIILEDDYDHEYHYKGQSLPPIASIDYAGIVMYISTLSKLVFPASRIGIAAIPEKYISQFAKNIQIQSRQNNIIFQDTIRRWISDGGFERHLLKTRKEYHKRRDLLAKLLEKYSKEYKINFSLPDGGLAIWCEFKCTNKKYNEILENSKKNQILIREFPEKQNSLRIEFSSHNENEITQGIKQLFD